MNLFEHLLADCQPNQEALSNMIAGMKKKRSDAKLNKNMIRSGLRYYAQYGPVNPFNNELTNEELDNIKAEDLVKLLHELTTYDHQVLYYGPMDEKQLSSEIVKNHIVPMSFKLPEPRKQKYTFTEQKSNEVLFADYDMVQAEIQWFRNGTPYNPETVPTVNMFNEYFGGNMSGIVFQEIRESKALAYSTYAAFGSPQKKGDPFSMSAYVGCQADKMKESIAAMQELLTALPKSEKLFSQSQASIKNSISTTRTTKTGILFSYLSAQKRGLNYDMNEKLYKSVDGFSYDSINTFFKQNIAGKPYTLTVVGGESKVNWDELKKFGPVKKLTLKDVFGY
jgi:predicted Zn-dependent peptidase